MLFQLLFYVLFLKCHFHINPHYTFKEKNEDSLSVKVNNPFIHKSPMLTATDLGFIDSWIIYIYTTRILYLLLLNESTLVFHIR